MAPNFMVVVPTDTEVKLTYSKTPLDWFFYSLTIVGIALCFYWRRRGDVVYASERPDWRRPRPTGTHELVDTTNRAAVDDTTPVDRPWSAGDAPAPAETAPATAETWFEVPPAPTDDDR